MESKKPFWRIPQWTKKDDMESRYRIKWLTIGKASGLLWILLACHPVLPQQKKDADLFTGATFKDVDLNGLTVRVGNPVEVTSQLGWHISWSK